MTRPVAPALADGFVRVRGARQHNLKNVDVDVPRDALVVFTGISGSGKSSLAFGTLYAEAQRRYFESVTPYARRLIDQVGVPDVDSIEGLPPAVALQQSRGAPTSRSSVGSVTTVSNSLRMLYSRAGHYPAGLGRLDSDAFSPNTPAGACPTCHGLGRVYDVTERSMVPVDTLTIRERAVAAWPPAWHGQNLRDILSTIGIDVDVPWRKLPKKERDWILFTEEQPTVPVYAGFTTAEIRAARRRKEEPSYMGTFTSAKRYVLGAFATTQSAIIKRRVSRYLIGGDCATCHGKRLRRESLSVTFSGLDIGELGRLSLDRVAAVLAPTAAGRGAVDTAHPEKAVVAERIARDLLARLEILQRLGLGYLSLERSTPTLSPGELQRLRLATQIRSNLFGVVYVMDEPSAGLHPEDTESLRVALGQLKDSGNSLFVVEHDVDLIRHADWIVDVGPQAGEQGGRILYSGPLAGLRDATESQTRRYVFERMAPLPPPLRAAQGSLRLEGVTRNNVQNLDVSFPLGVLTAVTGVSGSGKSSIVSQALVDLVGAALGQKPEAVEEASPEEGPVVATGGHIAGGLEGLKRLVSVDQKPIGRTPRSNLATYTGLFDHVRKLLAATKTAKARRYDAGRFSFNVAKGRCETCEGEGFVSVELLFMPSVYAPCPACRGARYNEKTLEVQLRGKNVAEVLGMTVDEAHAFFSEEPALVRALAVLRQVGLGYLRLGQPATELSGGEAQRIKLATELQRIRRGDTIYVLDEPTSGLHPADVDKLMLQLRELVAAGNTVVVVEHDMRVVASCDWVIDVGPGAGDAGGRIVAEGPPARVAKSKGKTAPHLARALAAG